MTQIEISKKFFTKLFNKELPNRRNKHKVPNYLIIKISNRKLTAYYYNMNIIKIMELSIVAGSSDISGGQLIPHKDIIAYLENISAEKILLSIEPNGIFLDTTAITIPSLKHYNPKEISSIYDNIKNYCKPMKEIVIDNIKPNKPITIDYNNQIDYKSINYVMQDADVKTINLILLNQNISACNISDVSYYIYNILK